MLRVESPDLVRELVADAIFRGVECTVSCPWLENCLQSTGVATFVEVELDLFEVHLIGQKMSVAERPTSAGTSD